MHVEPWLPRAAALRPGRIAVETPAAALTYSELLEAATGTAQALAACGVAPGERVAVVAEPGLDFAVALHACLLAGAAAVPVDPRLAAAERAARLAGASVTLAGPLPPPSAPPALAPWRADTAALVVHTSGTTRRPRPVVISHGNVLANALGSAVALGLDRDERWLCPLPLSHVGGLMVLLRSAVYATTAVLAPPPFDAERMAAALQQDVTLASLVPTMLRRVLAADGTPGPRLRAILLGGAPADRGLLRAACDRGYPVAQTYGLTEACSQVTVSEPGDLDTAGRALPGVSVGIEDDGEIVVGGPTVAGGGLLRTGDLGRLDDRGRLVVIGRRDDLIVTGGENVAPAEVEAVLLEHPDVVDAGVFGRPDPEWGQAIAARVVLEAGARAEVPELRAFCRRRLAGFKVPKEIGVVDALPRTPSGKLRRGCLA